MKAYISSCILLLLLSLAHVQNAAECINTTYPLVIGGYQDSTYIEHMEYHKQTDALIVGGYTYDTSIRGY